MTLKLILGDQLNLQHPWYEQVDEKVVFVLMEMRQETDYVPHHIQKVVAFFGAMRNFNEALLSRGHRTHYLTLNDKENTQRLEGNLSLLLAHYSADKFSYQEPDEYRLDLQLKDFCNTLSIPFSMEDSCHFMTSRTELATFFEGKKQFILEFFYRYMRRKYNLLMRFDQPEGGQWNFDKNNRNKWKGTPPIPPAYLPDGKNLMALKEAIEKAGVKTIGSLNEEEFRYPLSREEALKQLDYFCTHLLVHFGDYQDALHTDEVNLFHSRISFALNVKMIHPLEVVETVIAYYRKNQKEIALSQVEGFVRQILGWREYMRGIYWKEMPEYAKTNVLENTNPLPSFYWTGKTKMNCLHQSITNSLEHAYAHHIQRLMITGNFALLAQIHPDAVDEWYLGIYADAIQWVQITNTRGMSQWADGGIVATKPYVSAAAYIHKMSNYCDRCTYDKKKRVGEDACPFNSLYWNFLDDKKQYFAKNNRMAMMLRLLEKIQVDDLVQIKERASQIIKNPDAY
ncbi:MAG TPA: cryptochrome/photolyase family protein [Flavobacteriaceae bacterium]|jgi:deoxyribodipyrimidine photolyase-related protein|nr:cryptochrome/photolyase family protein [Flavobacteriaceae bacterium]